MSRPAHTEDRGILPDEEPLGTVLTRTCIGCGSEYEWTSREGFQWPTSYCTRKCKRRSSTKRRVMLESTDQPLAEGMVLLICGRCETPFGWSPPADPSGQHCPPTYHSQQCADRAHEKRKKDRRAQKDALRAVRRAEHEAAVAAKQQRVAEREARQARIDEANRLRLALEQRQRDESAQADRVAAISAAARELLLPASTCTTCGKVASPTKEAAKEAKRAIEQRAGRTNEVRYYQCPDGWWHWTRQDATLDGFRARQAELLMTESPASLRHRGRGAWNHLGETR